MKLQNCPLKGWPFGKVSGGAIQDTYIHFQSNLLLTWLGRQQIMTQVLGSLSTTWEIQMEFLASGFGLAQPRYHRHLWSEMARGRSLFLSVTLPFKQTNLKNKTKNACENEDNLSNQWKNLLLFHDFELCLVWVFGPMVKTRLCCSQLYQRT